MFHSTDEDRPLAARRKTRTVSTAITALAMGLAAHPAMAQVIATQLGASPAAAAATAGNAAGPAITAPVAPAIAPTIAPVVSGAQSMTVMAEAANRYTVRAGDQLDVFVWGEERMQRQVLVQPDGNFAFPLAGNIRAAGRNVTDIADEIRGRIALNYTAAPPDVTVTVRETDGTRFYVLGKVRTPGSFTSGSAPNILQALSMAGGIAEFADTGSAVILRQTRNGQVVERVRLSSLLKGARSLQSGALATPLPTLQSGDVLLIP